MMGKLGQMMGMGGGMPQPTPEQIEALQKQMGGAAPGAAPAPAFPLRRRPARSSCRRSSPACRARRAEAAGPRRRLQSVRRQEEMRPPGRFGQTEKGRSTILQ